MEIILSSRNPTKIKEIRALLDSPSIVLRTLDEAGIDGEAVEDGRTLVENAVKKALFARERALGRWTMADDTGLFIRGLRGEPGVRSARWAGENIPIPETTKYCLKRMEGIEDRSATFTTVVAVISPEGNQKTFTGSIKGTMLAAPRVPAQPKMPYSCLFVPDGQTKCWAEMTTEEENAISHRGIAFRKVRDFLEKQ